MKEKSLGLVGELKAFVLRGSVVELAVGVIIGMAFGKVVTSVVNDLIMPLVGIVLSGINFKELSIVVGSAKVTYGNFIQTVVEFLIIGVVLFVVIKAMNKLMPKKPEVPAGPSEEVKLLTEIRDSLRRR